MYSYCSKLYIYIYIGINLSEKISAPSLDNDIYKTMQGNNKHSLFFTQISIYEILNEVRNSKSKSSTDVTDFSMFIIKEIILEISPLLKHVFNRSLAEGIFPNVLKKAKVIPIFKSGDKSLAENYRPISLGEGRVIWPMRVIWPTLISQKLLMIPKKIL